MSSSQPNGVEDHSRLMGNLIQALLAAQRSIILSNLCVLPSASNTETELPSQQSAGSETQQRTTGNLSSTTLLTASPQSASHRSNDEVGNPPPNPPSICTHTGNSISNTTAGFERQYLSMFQNVEFENTELAPETVPPLPPTLVNNNSKLTATYTRRDGGKDLRTDERTLRIPEPKIARRVSRIGKLGSQLPMREVFNRLNSESKGVPYDKDDPANPISAEILRDALSFSRYHLYVESNLHSQKGKFTYRMVLNNHGKAVNEIKKKLESRHRVLKRAVACWAAEMIINEALRRDRQYEGPRSKKENLGALHSVNNNNYQQEFSENDDAAVAQLSEENDVNDTATALAQLSDENEVNDTAAAMVQLSQENESNDNAAAVAQLSEKNEINDTAASEAHHELGAQSEGHLDSVTDDEGSENGSDNFAQNSNSQSDRDISRIQQHANRVIRNTRSRELNNNKKSLEKGMERKSLNKTRKPSKRSSRSHGRRKKGSATNN